MSAKKDDFTLFRNDPRVGVHPSPGRPASSSNARLMRTLQKPENFSAGFIINRAGKYAQQMLDAQVQKLAKKMELNQLAEDIKLRKLCEVVEKLARVKTAGEEREPEIDNHESSPENKMRPRAELILYNREGIYGIDKGDYMLFPGGGVDDGEQPRDAAIRETLEEANRHPINVEGAAVVESVWPENSGNEFWDDSEFDGERTYFFCGLDRGDAGISHDDVEDFQVISFNTALAKLDELINREDQQWAKRNNEVRKELIKKAKRLVSTKAGRSPNKQAQAVPELNVPVEQGNVDMQPRAGMPADDAVSPVTGMPMSEARSFVQRIVQNIQPAQPQASPAPMAAPQAGTLTPTENAAPAPQPAAQPKMAFLDNNSMQSTLDDPFTTAKDVQQDVEGGMHGAPSAREQIAWAQADPIKRVYKNTKELMEKDDVIKEAGSEESLIGGYADNEPAEKYDARELVDGVLVELEHTNDGKQALEIAKDHLEEIPDYYSRLGKLEDDAKEDAGYGDKEGYEKKADLAQFLPQSQHILFTPDGRVIVRRGSNRRFVLPVEGPGRSAPYEDPVTFVPEGGVPQEGYHGYRIGTRVGEVEQVPEGFEALPPESVLSDLYASMGLSVNKPFRQIDRARVRTILRYMKKRKRQQEQAMEQAPPEPLPQAPFDFREA